MSCWGSNINGELGDGVSDETISLPTATSGGYTFSTIAMGIDHACGVLTTGGIDCWGANTEGDLGDGTYNDATTPIASVITTGAAAVAAGADFTCAIVSGGVTCWGAGDVGQRGDGSTNSSITPIRSPSAPAP